jgi:hypothetical protein
MLPRPDCTPLASVLTALPTDVTTPPRPVWVCDGRPGTFALLMASPSR